MPRNGRTISLGGSSCRDFGLIKQESFDLSIGISVLCSFVFSTIVILIGLKFGKGSSSRNKR